MKFIEIVGNASTTAFRGNVKIGHNVNAAAYEHNDNVVLKLESKGMPARGFNSIEMHQDDYADFCKNQGRPLFLRGIELFGCKTAF